MPLPPLLPALLPVWVKPRQSLLGHRFKLLYNPATGGAKAMTFLESGEVGEGRNANESS
jgi:hypothetical protein